MTSVTPLLVLGIVAFGLPIFTFRHKLAGVLVNFGLYVLVVAVTAETSCIFDPVSTIERCSTELVSEAQLAPMVGVVFLVSLLLDFASWFLGLSGIGAGVD